MRLFCTTFNKILFENHGRNFIESFDKYMGEYQLLIAYEGNCQFAETKNDNFIYYNLESDKWLYKILNENKDLIPKQFGGSTDWNDQTIFVESIKKRRWSLWFRKFPTLKQALEIPNIETVIFCDADTKFIQSIPPDIISQYDKYATFFHLGKKRKRKNGGFENGFTGFNLNSGGREFLELCFDKYDSGEFRNEIEWDDSYIMWKVYRDSKIKGIDLTPNVQIGSVMRHGPFKQYIQHFKGSNNKYFIDDKSILNFK